jgi:DNA-binding response OmpR family regulator
MSERKAILIVEDERDLADLLSYNLGRAGFATAAAHSGPDALKAVAAAPPDLILMDVMLPGLSGTEVTGRLRANPATASIPILMLTAKGEEVDQIVGLTMGADDYLTKPFSTKVLIARIHALLRRSDRSTVAPRALSLGAVSLNLDTHEAFVHGGNIHLTLTEFRLLAGLIHAQGRVLSRSVLMNRAMGPGVTVTERTIDVHITAIRRKLGDQGSLIKTVRGVGYRASTEPGPESEGVEVGPLSAP